MGASEEEVSVVQAMSGGSWGSVGGGDIFCGERAEAFVRQRWLCLDVGGGGIDGEEVSLGHRWRWHLSGGFDECGKLGQRGYLCPAMNGVSEGGGRRLSSGAGRGECPEAEEEEPSIGEADGGHWQGK